MGCEFMLLVTKLLKSSFFLIFSSLLYSIFVIPFGFYYV